MIKQMRSLPKGTTHVHFSSLYSGSNGRFNVSINAFKQRDGVWVQYETDSENENPQWRRAESLYFAGTWPRVLSELIELPEEFRPKQEPAP
jgi:hypothetical protein